MEVPPFSTFVTHCTGGLYPIFSVNASFCCKIVWNWVSPALGHNHTHLNGNTIPADVSSRFQFATGKYTFKLPNLMLQLYLYSITFHSMMFQPGMLQHTAALRASSKYDSCPLHYNISAEPLAMFRYCLKNTRQSAWIMQCIFAEYRYLHIHFAHFKIGQFY
jgi:hypothetical protein